MWSLKKVQNTRINVSVIAQHDIYCICIHSLAVNVYLIHGHGGLESMSQLCKYGVLQGQAASSPRDSHIETTMHIHTYRKFGVTI